MKNKNNSESEDATRNSFMQRVIAANKKYKFIGLTFFALGLGLVREEMAELLAVWVGPEPIEGLGTGLFIASVLFPPFILVAAPIILVATFMLVAQTILYATPPLLLLGTVAGCSMTFDHIVTSFLEMCFSKPKADVSAPIATLNSSTTTSDWLKATMQKTTETAVQASESNNNRALLAAGMFIGFMASNRLGFGSKANSAVTQATRFAFCDRPTM